jgi:hypothetical protein
MGGRALANAHAIRMMHLSARAASNDLLQKANVHLVTVGQKRVGGLRTPEPAVVVYVSKKHHVNDVDKIPSTIPAISGRWKKHGLKTDVVQLHSPPSAFGVRSGNLLVTSDRKTGVCGLAFTKNNVGYVLTNAHVACDVAHGGAPRLLAEVDPLSSQALAIGPVVWHSPLSPNAVASTDVAVTRADYVQVDDYRIIDIQQQIGGTSYFVEDNTAYWFSCNRTIFECAHPERMVQGGVIDVDGVGIQYEGFWLLHMTRGASAHGQSGALICRTEADGRIIACGLVFGGSVPDKIFAFSFDTLFQQVYNALP